MAATEGVVMPMPPNPSKNPDSPFASMTGHHVAIRVADYEASKRWFTEKLDFRVLNEWPYADMQLAYLAPPTDDTFHVEILGNGSSPTPKTEYAGVDDSLQDAGYHHVCLTVDNVDEALAELRRRGVTILGEPFDLEAIGRRLAFLTDPWGNRIELSQILR
jgi:lactoylglutathione lyase/glyoxylase I family protein